MWEKREPRGNVPAGEFIRVDQEMQKMNDMVKVQKELCNRKIVVLSYWLSSMARV